MKRVLVICLALCIALTMVGCGDGDGQSIVVNEIDFNGYPYEGEDNTLTYFMTANTAVLSQYDNFGKTAIAQELEKRTGIKVEYIHPPAGQEAQTLSLLIASGEMPDIMETTWLGYFDGPEKSIEEGIITPLNDFKEAGLMPNLSKFLEENPEIDKQVKTDSGKYYVFPFIRHGETLLRSAGLGLRRDWLNELGLSIPTTVEEMENVLRTFKEKKGLDFAMTAAASDTEQLLNGIAGASNSFYLKDGKVVYGPIEEEYKRALTILKRWYDEGLIDPNFFANDAATEKSLVLNDKVGVDVFGGGGDLGVWIEAKGPGFDMVGIPDLLNEEGKYGYGAYANYYPGIGSAAISATSTKKELAAIFLDYMYSEEGINLLNYGVEGETYTMVDGKPVFTDMIENNPDGLTKSEAMANYFRASTCGPFPQQEYYMSQFYNKPLQQESLANWTKSYQDVKDMVLPPLTLTAEEGAEGSELLTEIGKYVSKMRNEFINGTTDIETGWDAYVEQIEKLNIKRVIEIREGALARYNKR